MPLQQQANFTGLIRAGLWFGVLAFGVVIWFVHRAGTFPVSQPQTSLQYAQAALSVAAVLFALTRRRRVLEAPDLATRAALTISFWAVGEGAALLGGVIYLLSNDARSYGLGLLAMLTVFVLVPLPRPD